MAYRRPDLTIIERPFLDDPNVIIIDDIIESGKERRKYESYKFAALINKSEFLFSQTMHALHMPGEKRYIKFPWEIII